MAGRIQWRVDPIVARGFGPHQVFVYMASVYIDGRCLDSIACANRTDARKLAVEMARDCRTVSVCPDADAVRGGFSGEVE